MPAKAILTLTEPRSQFKRNDHVLQMRRRRNGAEAVCVGAEQLEVAPNDRPPLPHALTGSSGPLQL
jgi:hypothetical protein